MDQANELLHQANIELQEIWLGQIVFTWRWWLAVCICVLPWWAWVVWRDKKNSTPLLYAGFFIMILVCWLDTIGTAMGLWSYPTKTVPLTPSFPEFDLSAIPVGNMFMLQIMPNIKPITKSIILSLVASLCIQPFAVIAGLYNPKYWYHYYSIPFVVVIYLCANYLYEKMKLEQRNNCK